MIDTVSLAEDFTLVPEDELELAGILRNTLCVCGERARTSTAATLRFEDDGQLSHRRHEQRAFDLRLVFPVVGRILGDELDEWTTVDVLQDALPSVAFDSRSVTRAMR